MVHDFDFISIAQFPAMIGSVSAEDSLYPYIDSLDLDVSSFDFE